MSPERAEMMRQGAVALRTLGQQLRIQAAHEAAIAGDEDDDGYGLIGSPEDLIKKAEAYEYTAKQIEQSL